ncbi:MAG: zinc-ribbon domain-containing protein [Bacilli bacterium]
MYCTNCGKELKENASFCSSCGHVCNNDTNNKIVNKTKSSGDMASFILGIITLSIGILPTYFTIALSFILIASGIVGISFGAIGCKRSVFAKLGLIFSAIGLAFTIAYCIYMIIKSGSGIFIF